MENKKLNLKALQVSSFVTNMDQQNSADAKGGADSLLCPTLGGGGGCITVVTRGIWAYCCGESNPTVC